MEILYIPKNIMKIMHNPRYGEFDKWILFIHILQSTWILYKIIGEFDKLFHINHIPQYDLELYIIAG